MRRSVSAGSPWGDVVGYDQRRPRTHKIIERISAPLSSPLAMAVEISAIVVRRPE
jgi:hypothetical protein